MDSGLDELLGHPAIWRAKAGQTATVPVIATGFPALDAQLPGGGWPARGLIELLVQQPGTCELSLLHPALTELHRRQPRAWLVLMEPPYEPYAPALAARGFDLSRLLVIRGKVLWSMEQALRSASCRCVLGWLAAPQVRMTSLRRLQVAATEQGALCILFRPLAAGALPSPASLRLALRPGASRLGVQVLKCRGRHAGETSLAWQDLHGM